MKKNLRNIFILFFIVVTAYSYCAGQSTYEEFNSLTLYLGEIKIVPVKTPTRVVINNPTIADVASVSAEEMVISAKAAGATDIVWWDNFGEHVLRLEVFAENLTTIKERIDAIIKELRIAGVFTKRADSEDKVFLLGSVKEQKDKERIKLALGALKDKTLDLIEVKEEETTIEISVELMEIGKDAQKKLGFTMPNSITAKEQTGQFDGTLRGTANAIFHVFQWKRDPLFQATFDALAEEGKLKILSRPRLACQSGKEAELLVGGEKPIFSTGVVSGGGSSTSVEYKEYGIKLKIKPVITQEKQIKVSLKVEISEIQDSESIGGPNGITAQASPLTKRSASTELVLADGQTMAIGGLIKNKTEETMSKTLGLGDIPIFGMLFRKKTTNLGGAKGELGDAELFIALTPKIINQQESIVKGAEKQQVNLKAATLPQEALPSIREEGSIVLARYIQILTKRIHDNLNYPWSASQGQIEGVLRLSLNISSAGELLGVKVVQSSGFAVLDENALKTVKEVAPFPSFPSEIIQKELWVEIPIVYNLKK